MRPLVSIITVSYNGGKTIEGTIESVLNQTYPNIEYIIIDGASTDNTLQIINQYKDKFNISKGRKIIVISEADNGMYDALNKGARLASGELVGQINSDDWYERDAVEHMVRLYMKHKYDAAWGSVRMMFPKRNIIKHAKIKRIWTTSGWCHPGMFCKKNILLENPYACENMYDDFDFITTLYCDKKRIMTTDHIIANFSLGGQSTKKSLSEVKKRVDITYGIYKKHNMSKLYYVYRWIFEIVKYVLS